MSDEKPSIIPTEEYPANFKDMLPGELKREVRREWHWFLWLRLKTYAEITEITGFHRDTVRADIEEMQEMMAQTPIDHDHTRHLALTQLRMDHAEVIHAAREAKSEHAKAKMYKIAIEIHEKILERFTQPATINEQAVRSELDRTQAILDFVVEKFGPEALDDFEVFLSQWKTARAAQSS